MAQPTRHRTEEPTHRPIGRAQKIRHHQRLSPQTLARENYRYANTSGVSENSHDSGFVPAFHDTWSGRTILSRYADGRQAPIHLLDGIPPEWITERDADGQVVTVRSGVIAGFLRAGRFYTRKEAAEADSSQPGSGIGID